MEKILLASTNPGKLREIREILHDLNVIMVTPGDIDLHLNVIEDGTTYKENAALKALYFAQAANLTTLADDSGLEVDVLGGAPGLHSARYSPNPDATDAGRRVYLLEQLNHKPKPWTAQFRCVVALATPSDVYHYAEGTCHGEIIQEERGDQGFGYDPIFYLPEFERTMAELSPSVKNRISHRGRAVNAARPMLVDMLRNP